MSDGDGGDGAGVWICHRTKMIRFAVENVVREVVDEFLGNRRPSRRRYRYKRRKRREKSTRRIENSILRNERALTVNVSL